jgi:hypothetical protein
MSGAAKAVSNVGQAVAKPVVDATLSIPRTAIAVAKGEKGAALAGIKPFVRGFTKPGEDKLFGPESNIATGITEPIIGGPAPIDVEAVAADNKKAAARAKRQAQIDILTDRPGRGGAILTDQYQYKV